MKNNPISSIMLESLVISALAFLLIPLNLVSNNASDFTGFSYSEFFSYGILLTTISSIIVFLVFFTINIRFPKIRSKIATIGMGYLVTCGLYFSIRTGLMDGESTLQLSYLTFFIVLILLIAGALLFEKKLKVLIWIGLIGSLVTTVIGLNSLQPQTKQNLLSTHFFDVSTDHQNIFVISFDSLQSNYVEEVLNNNETLKAKFNGFINFVNVAAPAPFTSISTVLTKLGSIPETNMDTQPLVNKHNKTFITNHLRDEDYHVSIYSYFDRGEKEKPITANRSQLSTYKFNSYKLSFNSSLHKYIPIGIQTIALYINDIISKISILKGESNEITSFQISSDVSENTLSDKMDIFNFNYYVEQLKPTSTRNTAHFHHYMFTHSPVTFNNQCTYKNHHSVRQKKLSAIEETECALRKFVLFINKLKKIQAYDNSLIFFVSDHGTECRFNPSLSPQSYRVSERWCLSRYTPLLMLKPLNAKEPLQTDNFQSSLLDIPNTICETTNNQVLCQKYEGVNLLSIQPEDKLSKREILVIKESASYDARGYDQFDIVNISRDKPISEYFQIKFFPRIMLGKDLPSIIEGNIIGQGRLAEPKTHKKGFLTYGPYINLPAGEYIFELSYKSKANKKSIIGSWDIAINYEEDILLKSNLKGTNDKMETIRIPLSLRGETEGIEFRTYFNGKYEMLIEKIMLDTTNPLQEDFH